MSSKISHNLSSTSSSHPGKIHNLNTLPRHCKTTNNKYSSSKILNSYLSTQFRTKVSKLSRLQWLQLPNKLSFTITGCLNHQFTNLKLYISHSLQCLNQFKCLHKLRSYSHFLPIQQFKYVLDAILRNRSHSKNSQIMLVIAKVAFFKL